MDINQLKILLTLNGNKRLSHLEEEIFANTTLACIYLSALHNTEIDKNHVSYYVCLYAKDVLKGRWMEAEAAIKTTPRTAYYYAKDVIKDRWSEAEPIIATDPFHTYWYANDVIKGRWPEGESIIATNPDSAYYYAKDVLNGRWPEAEAIIKTDSQLWKSYCKKFNMELTHNDISVIL